MLTTGHRIVSTLSSEGLLTVRREPFTPPTPTGSQILVRVEAAPINPSDLGRLFGPADLETAHYGDGQVVAQMSEGATRALAGRHGLALCMGKCVGVVIETGEAREAQALLGSRVSCLSGAAYATHVVVEASDAFRLPQGVSAEEAAASFVNPMTALGILETVRSSGYGGLVHTAAASTVGQMLVRLCADEGMPLVNIVRGADQVSLLRDMGARHVVDGAATTFRRDLTAAITETGAMIAFDAVGGGGIANQILAAMESVATRRGRTDTGDYSLYGSNDPKALYVYGSLDLSATVLTRTYGYAWTVGGWLLTHFLARASDAQKTRMRARVLAELKTTFATTYKGRLTLEDMLGRDAVLDYAARRKGSKYLVTP